MRLLLTILTSILCTAPAFAQPYIGWVQRYNGPANAVDGATAIAVDSNGNIYVTGESAGIGVFNEYATVKYDSNGNQLWVARYNGPGNFSNVANALAVDANGNAYATGFSWGSGTQGDFATIKYYPNGDTAWVRRHNGTANVTDIATALTLDAEGNVYVTGKSSSFFGTIKYDSSGNERWVAQSGFDGTANALVVDKNGTVYVTGRSIRFGTGLDYATVKYDSNGNQLWEQHYDFPSSEQDIAEAIALDSSGNIYVTGISGNDYTTIKYNANGGELWIRRYDSLSSERDWALDIAVDINGNIYVTGNSFGDLTTVSYDSSGNERWVARFAGPRGYEDVGTDMALDPANGNIIVTGHKDGLRDSSGAFLYYDYATIKYDSLGKEMAAAFYSATSNGPDRATALAIDAKGNVYVTGNSFGGPSNFDFATIKYSPTPILKGDLDRSGTIQLTDITFLLNCVFFGVGDCSPSFSDTNCDGILSPTDVVVLLIVFFLSTTSPC